jgi:hypothetical protein
LPQDRNDKDAEAMTQIETIAGHPPRRSHAPSAALAGLSVFTLTLLFLALLALVDLVSPARPDLRPGS